ncbi:serine/threonine-protein kinase/endoribonuclease IRE1b-like protein [Tanacetum coccineum]
MHALGLTFLASLTYDTGYDQGLEINSKLTKLLTKNLEAYDIITKLLHYKNYPRFTYTTVYLHPIFWTWDRRLRFLVDSFEVLKMLQKENKNSNILRELNRLGYILFTRPWADMVDRTWYDSMTKSKYPHDDDSEYSDDVYGLLKIISNINNHLLQVEWEEWDRERMAYHISKLYPTLAMHIYMTLKLYFPRNKVLKVYYPACNL